MSELRRELAAEEHSASMAPLMSPPVTREVNQSVSETGDGATPSFNPLILPFGADDAE
jgi:hypothetical protein